MEENNTDLPAQAGKSTSKWNVIWEFAKIFIIATLIVLPIRYFLFQPFIVKGDSMVPNFHDGNYLIVDEISYNFSQPQRGDVIVFKYPKDTTQRFIKRVIGLPGETVDITGGKITISKGSSSFILDEKYLPSNFETLGGVKTTVGPNEYFVLGDNRDYSYDSRIWGTVPIKDVIGKVFLRLFPVAAISEIARPIYQ